MPGGIQPGTIAWDPVSRKNDDVVKVGSLDAIISLQETYNDITYQIKLNPDQIPGGIGACQPDGFLIFYKTKLIAAAESKKQNEFGNAIERWFKNENICRTINPTISYITFCCGSGTEMGGPIQKTLNFKHPKGFNSIQIFENTTLLQESSYTMEYVSKIVYHVVENHINLMNNERIDKIEKLKNEIENEQNLLRKETKMNETGYYLLMPSLPQSCKQCCIATVKKTGKVCSFRAKKGSLYCGRHG